MSSKHEMYLSRALGFVLICTVTLMAGTTARELVWGLYIASVVSGSLALLLPLWVFLLFPKLDKKLFPQFDPPDFSIPGSAYSIHQMF